MHLADAFIQSDLKLYMDNQVNLSCFSSSLNITNNKLFSKTHVINVLKWMFVQLY